MGLLIDYLRDKLPKGESVYVIGPEIVCEELRRNKVKCFEPGKDEMDDEMTENIFEAEIEVPENVGAVLVGFNVHINYLKILKASRLLRNKNCLFIMLDPVENIPTRTGDLFPSTKAITACQ